MNIVPPHQPSEIVTLLHMSFCVFLFEQYVACTIRLLTGRKILRRLNVLIEAESRVLFPRQTEAVETLQKKGQQSFLECSAHYLLMDWNCTAYFSF